MSSEDTILDTYEKLVNNNILSAPVRAGIHEQSPRTYHGFVGLFCFFWGGGERGRGRRERVIFLCSPLILFSFFFFSDMLDLVGFVVKKMDLVGADLATVAQVQVIFFLFFFLPFLFFFLNFD